MLKPLKTLFSLEGRRPRRDRRARPGVVLLEDRKVLSTTSLAPHLTIKEAEAIGRSIGATITYDLDHMNGIQRQRAENGLD